MNSKSKTTQLNSSAILWIRFLFFAILVLAFYQFGYKAIHLEKIVVQRPFFLLFSMVLIPLNLMLEWRRFNCSISDDMHQSVDLSRTFYQGIVVSFFTPQLFATTLGRFQSFSLRENQSIFVSGIAGAIAQFTITMLFASVGSFLVIETFYIPILFGILALLSLLTFYFKPFFNARLSKFLGKEPFPNKALLLLYSFLRYMVFSVQFHCILFAFGLDFSYQQLWILMLSYGLTSLSPAILFGKVIMREAVALAVFSMFYYDKNMILCTAFLTWCFNVLTPMVFSLTMLSLKWKRQPI